MNFPRDCKGMDGRLWSGLPEDIIERVLAFLPVADLLRFRCVCRPWNSLLSARRPLETVVLQDSSSRQPCLLCLTTVGSHSPTVHVFNVELGKWSELSLRFLLTEMVDISVIAACGGLLYLLARVASNAIYLTCNPLTKSWRELPPPIDSQDDENEMVSVGMLTSMATCRNPDIRQGGRYQIIEAGFNGLTDLSTKIFDSSTRLWSMSGSIPSEVTGFESEGVIINECLYGITCLPSRLLKMEVVEGGGEWSEFSAGLPSFAVYPHLVDNMGSLAIVAGFDTRWNEGEVPEPTELKIWKLNEAVMSWKEISTLPEELCQKYLSNDSGSFDSLRCAAHGDAIYVATHDGSVILAYDSSESSWSRLPECPSLANRLSCVEQFFIFNPSLQSSV